MSNLTKNKHFCILPWIHLYVAQSGKVSPCCNNNRYLGNVQEKSIEEIWNGTAFDTVRNQFENNLPDKRCAHCYNIEASGKQSMRQISNAKYAQEVRRVANNNPTPIYLDIRFSNICNFKCKTCWHGNSSAWFEEGGHNNASKERVIKAFTNNFDELLPYLNEVHEIYFAGGEPLIMEEHYQLLDELEKRELYHIELRYNTNFSTLLFKNKNIFDRWNKFQKVHVSASVDASAELGANIREGFNWKEFIANRKQMIRECSKAYFEVAPTVSTLNVLALPKLHQELVELGLIGIDDIYLNFLERPVQYNLKSLIEIEKQEVIKHVNEHLVWLAKKNAGTGIVSQFKNLLNYLQ